jgi:hypothetical protein
MKRSIRIPTSAYQGAERKRINLLTEAQAHRKEEPWAEVDYETVARKDISLVEMACLLGRTYNQVSKLRKLTGAAKKEKLEKMYNLGLCSKLTEESPRRVLKSRLTEQEVELLRVDWALTGIPVRRLADIYEISQYHVRRYCQDLQRTQPIQRDNRRNRTAGPCV